MIVIAVKPNRNETYNCEFMDAIKLELSEDTHIAKFIRKQFPVLKDGCFVIVDRHWFADEGMNNAMQDSGYITEAFKLIAESQRLPYCNGSCIEISTSASDLESSFALKCDPFVMLGLCRSYNQ